MPMPTHPALLDRDRCPPMERIGRGQIGEGHGIRFYIRCERSNKRACPELARLELVRLESPVAVGIRPDVAHPVVGAGDVIDRGLRPHVVRFQVAPGRRWGSETLGAGRHCRERSRAAAVFSVCPRRRRRLCRAGPKCLHERHNQGHHDDLCQATAKPMSPLGHDFNVGPPRAELKHRGEASPWGTTRALRAPS